MAGLDADRQAQLREQCRDDAAGTAVHGHRVGVDGPRGLHRSSRIDVGRRHGVIATLAVTAPTPFHDLDQYIALPRLGGLTLSLDGTRLVVAMNALDPKRTRYVTSLWEVDPEGETAARRLTRSAKGENGAAFLPDGSLLFVSERPDPDGSRRRTRVGVVATARERRRSRCPGYPARWSRRRRRCQGQRHDRRQLRHAARLGHRRRRPTAPHKLARTPKSARSCTRHIRSGSGTTISDPTLPG